jgi:putative membrane protein
LFPLTREAWGLTPLADQQIAGLLMWIPGATVYLGGIAFTFARWFAAEHAAPSTFDGTTAR